MNSNQKLPAAFLFDFDGVIVDSFHTHFDAWKSAFLEMFNKEITVFPHDILAGKSPIIIASYFCESVDEKDKAKDLFLLKSKHLNSSTKAPDLLPGIREIKTFIENKSVPHGIASNASREFVKNINKMLSLGFLTTFGLEDYKNPKPNPEPYIKLAEALSIAKEDYKNTWVFEDSLTGVKAAKAAGMIPIGILTNYSEEELRDAGSVYVFKNLLEAYQFLKG